MYMLLENPEIPVFFRTHLEMVVNLILHSYFTKTYAVYTCGINTFNIANYHF